MLPIFFYFQLKTFHKIFKINHIVYCRTGGKADCIFRRNKQYFCQLGKTIF